MIIQLNARLRIKGTETCWELQKSRSRNGNLVWEPFKYFATFRQALEEAVQREIRLHPAEGIAVAIEAVTRVSQAFEQLIPSDIAVRIIKSEGS
jgi:hypothetical protein